MNERTRFEAFVFDCDGTLLDTLPDLAHVTNRVLELLGHPTHTTEEILTYVGNGGRRLIAEAMPKGASQEDIDAAFALWQRVHASQGMRLTKEYEGITVMLQELKKRGAAVAVLSNKFDAGIQEIVPEYFPGIFEIYHGESVRIPRKPDPFGLLTVAHELGVDPARIAYVGDSRVDMLTAKNAGCFALGVSWGYQPCDLLRDGGADVIVDHPEEILSYGPPEK